MDAQTDAAVPAGLAEIADDVPVLAGHLLMHEEKIHGCCQQ
ncbi:hypothetical protein [Synechococcus sp. RSCCF101]|nr:hypothetical protein [Synechococcus sp. RSCCF101]